MLGLVLGNIILDSPYAAICLTLIFIISISLLKSPLRALSAFIFVIPFSGTSLFNDSLINLPGAKPLNLLAFFVIFVAMLNLKQSIKIPGYAFFFISSIVIIFTISFLRSVQHLDVINHFRQDDLSILRYLLSDFVKPLLYFMPLIIVIRFVHKPSNFEFVVNVIFYTIVAFSLVLLFFYIGFPSKGNLKLLTEYYSLTFGMHRNDIANFYIVAFSLFLTRFFIYKDIISFLSIGLVILATGILMSRTAYFIMLFSSISYLIVSGRSKFFPIIIIISVGLSFIITSNVMERAMKGVQSKDINEISAGRTNHLWIPLANEYLHDYKKLLIGNGRYSIYYSESSQDNEILNVGHPHNMYLEQLMDAGLIGLSIFLSFFIILFKRLVKSLRFVDNNVFKEYHYGLIISLIAYLMAGVTGRFLFPIISNSYFWIIVGLSIVLTRMTKNNAEYQ